MTWVVDASNVIGSRPDAGGATAPAPRGGWWRNSTASRRCRRAGDRRARRRRAAARGARRGRRRVSPRPRRADDEIVALLEARGADGARVVDVRRRAGPSPVRAWGGIEGAGGFRRRLDEV
jgi:hypothetical protein